MASNQPGQQGGQRRPGQQGQEFGGQRQQGGMGGFGVGQDQGIGFNRGQEQQQPFHQQQQGGQGQQMRGFDDQQKDQQFGYQGLDPTGNMGRSGLGGFGGNTAGLDDEEDEDIGAGRPTGGRNTGRTGGGAGRR